MIEKFKRNWSVIDVYPKGQALIDRDAVIAVAPGENGTRIFLEGGAIIIAPGDSAFVFDEIMEYKPE